MAENNGNLLKINFSTFVFSLAGSAQVHLGLIPNPADNKKEVSLPLAKQSIDILELLKEKTKGNLSNDEGELLDHLLFDLRMRFVEEDKKKGGS